MISNLTLVDRVTGPISSKTIRQLGDKLRAERSAVQVPAPSRIAISSPTTSSNESSPATEARTPPRDDDGDDVP